MAGPLDIVYNEFNANYETEHSIIRLYLLLITNVYIYYCCDNISNYVTLSTFQSPCWYLFAPYRHKELSMPIPPHNPMEM